MSQGPPTIIVVDDDNRSCRALDRLLGSAGYQVQTFTSLQAIQTRLPEDGPGCAVLEVSMPGLDGLQLQQELAASGRAWPIIFVSGRGSIATCVRAMKAGAIDFLTKPVEDVALLQAIERALVRDAAERAERAIRREQERRVARLTPREYAVFRLMATGALNKQIAARLRIAERTVKAHRSHVMEKLEVQSLAELVQLAIRVGVSGPIELEAISPTLRTYAAA